MKKIYGLIFMVLFLVNCTPVPKYELPTKGDPPLVCYTTEKKTLEDRNLVYQNVMNRFKELYPDAKIISDDKSNCYFQVIGYSPYDYKGKVLKFSFMLSFQGEKDYCSLLINRIKMKHYEIEHMYRDKKNKTTKAFNPVYEQIDIKIKSVLNELINQIK